jgi:hypothetical protein
MLLSFFPMSRPGTKRVPHSIKGTNIRRNNLRMTLYRDSFTRRPTSRSTRTAYMQRYTSNTIHERAYDERTTYTTVQFSTPARRVLSVREPCATEFHPVYPDVFVSSLDHPTGTISAEMIVMVVQPHPARGSVARWHCVPGGAGVLPADVSPLTGDTIFNSLVAYPMGAGRTRIAPGKKAGKGGERSKVKNVVAIWLSPHYWCCSSSTVIPKETPRLSMPKTGMAMLSLASPEAMRMTFYPSGTLVFSSTHLDPAKRNCAATKGKRL